MNLYSELKSFPANAHWFCPRRHDEDQSDYDHPDEAEEDISPETKHELIQDAKRRHGVAYKYSLILGLDPGISGHLLDDYTRRLNKLLRTCDKCVHNWHMGRKAYLKELAEQFDDNTVAELSNRLNVIDFQRLDNGLEAGKTLLAKADAGKRTQALLAEHDTAALLALYEALCCVDYHKSEEKLSAYFNYVFEEVQNRKILRIGDTLPAMARFLFDIDKYRLRFATNAWQKMKAKLTPETFEWVVHDALSEAIVFVSHPAAKHDDVQRFWEGVLLILDKMDEDLITHSLRGMEVQPDIYHLALQHLAVKSDNSESIVHLVIEALRGLLKKAPKDFWAALGTISPATTAEQIFQAAGFEKLLVKAPQPKDSHTYPALAWIPELIDSLDSVHQYDACRSLLYHLLERLQEKRFSENARLACCRAGLDALRVTLNTFVGTNYNLNPSTSLIVINDIMGLVDQYKAMIVGCADLEDDDGNNHELKKLGMVVIRDSLALDCKALSAQFIALSEGVAIQRGLKNHSQPTWQAVLEIFRPGNVELAKSILAATSALTGLDQIRPADKKNPNLMPKDQVQFNDDFRQLMDNISRIFERLTDFEPSDLRQMYQDPQTSRPLFAALVSADQGTYEAAVEVIKAATGHMGKQDAMASLLEQAFAPMLNSLTYAVSRMTKSKTFGPVPYMIKIGREVLKALCGNTGILRTRSALSPVEQNAIMTWWTNQWRALDMVFSTTESWVSRVDKTTAYMQDFCRDAMEYAETLFDHHSIIASALREVSSSDNDPAPVKKGAPKASLKKVLDTVCHNVNGLTMMLRLRDGYLVSVITSLLGKLLRCLGEYDLSIDKFASDYIKDACKGENERNFKRTNLTKQQKAELQRALDEHQGLDLNETPPPMTAKKQATIDAWSRSADGKRHEPTLPAKGHGLTMVSDQHKHVLDHTRTQKAKKNEGIDNFREQRRRAEAEMQKQKAVAIAKAQALRVPAGLVNGEGSGLKGIGGVAGKEHGPVRSEIMVGSSDEDSDDDDDEDDTNALVKTIKESNQKVSEYQESRRRALKLQQQGPVKKTKIQRSAKDLRARVEPNMDKLYQEILNWDIFHSGDDPPSNNECRRIDDKYLDLDLYKRTFGPLLISEVWRSLATAKEENNFKPVEIKILNRLSVDKFMEISTNMPMSANKDLKMSERDIVLLSKSPDPLNNPKEPHCLARIDRTNRKKDIVEVTYRVSRDINSTFLQCLVPNGKVHALKIADMTTTQREFAALSSLEYYDLCNEVLEARPSPIQKYSDEKIVQISGKYALNRGQAQAILSANDNDGFTLIQG
jgi:senataxin